MTDTLVRMPKLADTLVEGTVARWLKQVGERVSAGEPLAAIETDKVTTELTSPASGEILELLVAEGATVPIEAALARIGSASAAPIESSAADSAVAAADETIRPTPTATPRVTPVAQRLLAEHRLTAEQIGATGRVTKADVLRYLETAPRSAAPAPPAASVPLTSMRRAIAEHMVRAAQTIPHGQTVMQADLTALAAWRDRTKAAFQDQHGAPLTYTVLFVHALAGAVAARHQPVDLGVAVALDQGLIVPVIRSADGVTLGQTAQALDDLAQRARAGRLQPAETHGALMTVTNVGSFGNLVASPIVPLQQIGILGPGLVERRPMPGSDGSIRIGARCWLTLMFDRREFDDFGADRLLRSVIDHLTSTAATPAQ